MTDPFNTEEPSRKPCPACGKAVTWTQAGKPRSHKCVETQAEEVKPVTSYGVTVDAVVAKFIETRDLIEAKQKALDAELADLKALQQKRSDWIKTKLEELGCDNFKTAHGTAFIMYKDSATVADGEVFKNWVHEDWEGRKFYLNNAVNKTAVKQALDEGQIVPPGVNYSRFKDVGIRRK